MSNRIGLGFDVHAFAPNRELILGGICIDYKLGLLGHSDADVLTHALMDALLGALALGDIGKHFPDTDEKYKNANSMILLQNVYQLIKNKGYELVNADMVIIAQEPKLESYKQQIEKNIAQYLQANKNQISVKASTTEKLGFVGKKEGIAAQAIVLLEQIK